VEPPGDDKVVAFDRARAAVQGLLAHPEAMAAATAEEAQELLARTVERVLTADRPVAEVAWRPQVRPFLSPSPAVE
jgi:hypothetical protein